MLCGPDFYKKQTNKIDWFGFLFSWMFVWKVRFGIYIYIYIYIYFSCMFAWNNIYYILVYIFCISETSIWLIYKHLQSCWFGRICGFWLAEIVFVLKFCFCSRKFCLEMRIIKSRFQSDRQYKYALCKKEKRFR